ncbi:hypothetical protein M3G03_03855 [Aestuariimicrobium sp. p3-SID1156]|uniref:NADase-type glycan-binding domain-containing protein n=1 Tax=Aestuariimicrobium sp. p3-SID1156 TaxID=2916038 RepID=UPI00223AB1F8|nr:hypothetical protein [Aestuariimicrobium sp. p3-SID1156]MCT1458685.1 hypothetical protein [Aestuariimicrobium sp. p3-SID1156]
MSADLPDELFRPRTPAVGGSTLPVVTSAKAASSLPGRDRHPAPEHPSGGAYSRGPAGLLMLLAVSLAALVGLAGGQLVHRATARTSPTTTVAPSHPQSSSSPAMPWDGPVATIPITSVEASCVAPEELEPSGETLSFEASRAVDGQAHTAWRCNGNGVGQRLWFRVPDKTVLAGVSVVNGWTRDEGKASLYDQFRRVTSVRWDLPDGSWFVQNLSDNDHGQQSLMIPPTPISGIVRMTILSSTKPGRPDQQNRDAVLLSEVSLFTQR